VVDHGKDPGTIHPHGRRLTGSNSFSLTWRGRTVHTIRHTFLDAVGAWHRFTPPPANNSPKAYKVRYRFDDGRSGATTFPDKAQAQQFDRMIGDYGLAAALEKTTSRRSRSDSPPG
jgi:hypothetical protein